MDAVLLTGATGIVGGSVLAELLRATDLQVICLVRPGSNPGSLRIRDRIGPALFDLSEDRISIIEGTLGSGEASISFGPRGYLQNTVRFVVHAAGETAFLRSRDLFATNVDGLRHLLALASTLPRLTKFISIGTAACSYETGATEMPEREVDEIKTIHEVPYTKSKADAERILFSSGLAGRCVSIRPSYIVPDVDLTERAAAQTVFPLVAMATLPAIPIDKKVKVDLVRVSFVVAAILAIMFSSNARRIYHVASGRSLSPRWYDLTAAVASHYSIGMPSFVGETPADGAFDRKQMLILRRLRPYVRFLNRNVAYSNGRILAEYPNLSSFNLSVMGALSNLFERCSLEAAFQMSASDI